jgi:AraC-like DNA-binding protein
MISHRCESAVQSALDGLGLKYDSVGLGRIDIPEDCISSKQKGLLKTALAELGFELMEDRKMILIEKIKKLLVEMMYNAEGIPKINRSVYISQKLGYDYKYLSTLFSTKVGMTITNFVCTYKIEKAKELLLLEHLNLTEISYRLNYYSVAHLCKQFRKITGLTPSHFKKLNENLEQRINECN